MKRLCIGLLLGILAGGAASAEVTFSVYGGVQDAPSSNVSGNEPGGLGVLNFTAGWQGKSFDMPPYYGGRVTWWRNENLGYGVDFTHAKIYADNATLAANGFSRLELTDGLNLLTANVYYRWPSDARRWTPYAGIGAGVAVPHVDIQTAATRVFEYQLAGPTVELTAGVSYQVNEKWSVFGEYTGNYSWLDLDLTGGGSLHTDVMTNALNIGVSFSF